LVRRYPGPPRFVPGGPVNFIRNKSEEALQARVYHFTDTARLPWIIQTGELRPDPHRLGGFPADFVWATLNAGGDRTSAAGLHCRASLLWAGVRRLPPPRIGRRITFPC
jgi:hypothetical protein